MAAAPEFPTRPLADWTLQDAQEAVAAHRSLGGALDDDAYEANAAYVERQDHWQGGATWIGPGDPKAHPKIQEQFTPVDVIGDALDRAVNALLKRPPTLDVVAVAGVALAPLPAADGSRPALADPAVAAAEAKRLALRDALATWAKRVKLRQAAKLTAKRARWAGRAVFRCWVPSAHLVRVPRRDDAGRVVVNAEGQPETVPQLPSGLTLADALARVELTACLPDAAAVFVDERTRRPVGVFLFRTADDKEAAEVWTLDGPEDVAAAQAPGGRRRRGAKPATAAAPAVPRTRCRVLVEGQPAAEAPVFAVDLGGRLPLVELAGDLLVTEPVRRQQAQCNFFNSLLTRNGEVASFPERYIINAEPNGAWVTTLPAGVEALETKEIPGDPSTGGRPRMLYLVPAARTLGASVTTELQGVVIGTDEKGKETRATPQVVFRDPTDPAYLASCVEHARRTILRSCKQGHMAAVGASGADRSGVSYEQERADFEDDATAQAEPLEAAFADLAAVAFGYARPMTTEAERPDVGAPGSAYRVAVTVHVDTGPRSPDDRRADGEAVKDGRLPRRTALQRDGVVDVDAAIAEIDADPVQRALRSKVQAEAVGAWTTGASAGQAAGAALVGLSDADRETLRTNAGVAPGMDDPAP